MKELGDVNIYGKWNRRNWLIAVLILIVFGILEWRFFVVERAIPDGADEKNCVVAITR